MEVNLFVCVVAVRTVLGEAGRDPTFLLLRVSNNDN